jgi:uncharacterized protein
MASIIDFRVRPPIAGFENATMYRHPDRTAAMGAKFGFPASAPTLRDPRAETFEKEFANSSLKIAVIPGRIGAPGVGPASNSALIDYARKKDGRIVVFPAVDPCTPDWRQNMEQLVAGNDIVKGVTLEPGLLHEPVYPDAPCCLPVYDFCVQRNLPLILSAGGNVGPDCSYTLPIYVDRVARDFPELRIVVAHGGWPWITEINHVAFRRGNVYVSPDMYALMPGNEAYIAAMNSYLSERYVFASSYPFVPLRGYVEAFLKIIRNDATAELILFKNGAKLLKLK